MFVCVQPCLVDVFLIMYDHAVVYYKILANMKNQSDKVLDIPNFTLNIYAGPYALRPGALQVRYYVQAAYHRVGRLYK